MQSLDEILDKSNRGRKVRWPFRLLATVIVLGALFGTLGCAVNALRHKDLRAALLALSSVPLTALVARLGGYAVWKGYVIRKPYWPFASGSVVLFWLLISWIIVSYA